MIQALVTVLLWLGISGALPAWVLARRSPVVVFLAPLVGSVLAAVAVELELVLDGPLLLWFILVVVMVNAGALWIQRIVERNQDPTVTGWSWTWSLLTVGVLIGTMVIPLSGLRSPMIGFDANAIWLTHTLLVSSGHHTLIAGLQNFAYAPSNPDYPPLVPASGGLALSLFGTGSLRVAIEVTALLNACAVGVVGVGIASIRGGGGRTATRSAALVVAAGLCLVGFALAGNYAVNGYADLLWSAAAVGAVVWGLVLPRSRQALAVAWACGMVASLTKNEGLVTSLIVLGLISFRYVPVRMSWSDLHTESAWVDHLGRTAATRWIRRTVYVVGPALPGLIWIGIVRHYKIADAFFSDTTPESIGTRARATADGMAAHLAVVPVAAVVLMTGYCLLRSDRQWARIANPLWLWGAWVGALAGIAGTYVFGSLEIHWWLQTSVDRTTIFPAFVLYADLAIWILVAVDGSLVGSRQWTSVRTVTRRVGTDPDVRGDLEVSGTAPVITGH